MAQIRNPKQILNSKDQIAKLYFTVCLEIIIFGHFEFVSNFACLREAASAKAGISCFEFLHLISIESSSCFSAEITCINILLEERAGAVFRIPKTLIEHLHDG